MLATIAYGPHAFIQGELLSYNKRDNIGTVVLDGMTYAGELVTLGLENQTEVIPDGNSQPRDQR